MGSIEKITCKACGKSWQYKIGCGIKHSKLEAVLDLFDENAKEQVSAWAVGKDIPLFQFGYKGAVCDKCRAVIGIPVLKLFPENTLYVAKCEECGNEVELQEEGKTISCPECGGQSMENCREGLWD